MVAAFTLALEQIEEVAMSIAVAFNDVKDKIRRVRVRKLPDVIGRMNHFLPSPL